MELIVAFAPFPVETASSIRKFTWLGTPSHITQARPGVLGIRYPGLFQFRYMVFFGQNSGIKYSVFPEI